MSGVNQFCKRKNPRSVYSVSSVHKIWWHKHKGILLVKEYTALKWSYVENTIKANWLLC